jgi:WD40 repeat protein
MSIIGVSWASADDEPGPIVAEEVTLDRPVDFRQDVLPIFQAKCLACHSESVKEGSLVLETAEAIVKGGDSGAAVVPGKPDESLLFLQASRQQESFMPPLPNDVNARPLTPREAGLVKRWIAEGAKSSTSTGGAISWQSLPVSLQPIYSVALSPDETLLAVGRGNRIAIYDVLRHRQIGTLTDPALGEAAHRDFVHALDFSPDGQWLASGGYRIVKLWKQVSPIEEQRPVQGTITRVAASPDGKWMAIGLSDGGIRIESRSPGTEARLLAGAGEAVSALTFTADSAAVVSAAGKTVRRWNTADGALAGELTTPAAVAALVPSPDAAQIITAHADGVIRVWAVAQIVTQAADAAPPAPQAELRGHAQPVTSLAWATAESPRLVSASEDGSVRLWDVAAGMESAKLDNGAAVADVVSSPDGKHLATLGRDGVVRLWEVAGKKLADLSNDPRPHNQAARCKDDLSVAQSRKANADTAVAETEQDLKGREESLTKANEQLAAANKAVEEAKAKATAAEQQQKAATDAAAAKPDDEALKKAQTDAEAQTKAAQEAVTKAEDAVESAQRGVELSQKSIATAKADLQTRQQQRDAETAQEQKAREALTAAEAQVTQSTPAMRSVTFTPDGSALVTVDAGGLMTLWHVATQRALATIPTETAVVAVASASDGRLLAGTGDGRLLVIRSEPQWELAGHLGPTDEAGADLATSPLTGRVLALDFSPDGARLAAGGGVPSRSGQLAIWNVADRTLDREVAEAHSDTVFDVAFSREGTLLASGAADKFAKVFDSTTGELRNTFEGHTGHVLGVSWIADGSRLATAGADNAIKVWNTATGEQTRTITSHQKPVEGLSFIGTSENIASASGDKSVLLHTASNGKNYRRCDGATDFLHAVTATRDESLIIAGGEAGIVRLWNGADGKLLTSFEPPPLEGGDQQASR